MVFNNSVLNYLCCQFNNSHSFSHQAKTIFWNLSNISLFWFLSDISILHQHPLKKHFEADSWDDITSRTLFHDFIKYCHSAALKSIFESDFDMTTQVVLYHGVQMHYSLRDFLGKTGSRWSHCLRIFRFLTGNDSSLIAIVSDHETVAWFFSTNHNETSKKRYYYKFLK